jgi:hypothetical protein
MGGVLEAHDGARFEVELDLDARVDSFSQLKGVATSNFVEVGERAGTSRVRR